MNCNKKRLSIRILKNIVQYSVINTNSTIYTKISFELYQINQ